jgi:hypothetical protein
MFSNREGTPGFALAGALIGDSEGPRPRSAATIRSGPQDIYRKQCRPRASPIEDELVPRISAGPLTAISPISSL